MITVFLYMPSAFWGLQHAWVRWGLTGFQQSIRLHIWAKNVSEHVLLADIVRELCARQKY